MVVMEEDSESGSECTRSPSPDLRRPVAKIEYRKDPTTFGLVTMVVKRDGSNQSVKVHKIQQRIDKLAQMKPALRVDVVPVVQSVVSSLCNGITTQELDLVAVKAAAGLASTHPDYGNLASRISVSNMHKTTKTSFRETMTALSNRDCPLVSDKLISMVETYSDIIDEAIDYERDYNLSHFAMATLERSYLLSGRDANGNPVMERPQHLFMREALTVGGEDWRNYYDVLSNGYFTHASPTMFNAGTVHEQLSSCFLVSISDDSIDGIYKTLKDCALISKGAGGVGIDVCNIRASGSKIANGGVSSGVVPLCQVYERTAAYVDQGGGKRKGAFAMYVEPWHADIYDFVGMKDPQTTESMRALDLFLGMWIPDLFYKRVEESVTWHRMHPTDTTFTNWSLFCPRDVPGLHEAYGDTFEQLYSDCEEKGLARRKVDAMALMHRIIDVQIMSGGPYMLCKDTINKLSNQKHLGPIRLSNLCTEITEYTEPGQEIAVCNLVSIALPKFVKSVVHSHQDGSPSTEVTFDHNLLGEIVRMAVRSLNRVIDINKYPVEISKKSNLRHRPIGIGVQGLADLFIAMGLPFESPTALVLNRAVFETMYYNAVYESCEIAKKEGAHDSFGGSPLSKGKFHWELFDENFPGSAQGVSDRWDWEELRGKVVEYGTRNSLFIAPMPTASTAQILGNSEGLEAIQSMIFTRNVLSGEFQIINTPLIERLIKKGVWNEELRCMLIQNGGSVQDLPLDAETKALFKTAWEIKQRVVIDMAAARQPFVDQSGSNNLFVRDPKPNTIFNMHMYAWKKHLKTGMYYLRSQPGSTPNRSHIASIADKPTDKPTDTSADESTNSPVVDPGNVACHNVEGCVMCGS